MCTIFMGYKNKAIFFCISSLEIVVCVVQAVYSWHPSCLMVLAISALWLVYFYLNDQDKTKVKGSRGELRGCALVAGPVQFSAVITRSNLSQYYI